MDNIDRISILIDKLKDQHQQGLSAHYMAVTAQMLLAELSGNPVVQSQNGSVVVIAPSTQFQNSSDFEQTPKSVVDNTTPAEAPVERANNRFSLPFVELPEIPFLKEAYHTQVPETKNVENSPQTIEPLISLPVTSITKAAPAEIHEVLNTESEPMLNEKLKEEKKELASLLNEAPIADLRRAIGINDRFVFIQELFNADETMYERCIKTINSFTTYSEAEGWIQRELKVKLGWKEDSESVQHFDQLVMRRFS